MGSKAFRERSGKNGRTHEQQWRAIPAEGGQELGRHSCGG